jgi:hypothetical protein
MRLPLNSIAKHVKSKFIMEVNAKLIAGTFRFLKRKKYHPGTLESYYL